jgi:FdhE protein
MNKVIEDIISRKPHLAEPLRFYEKVMRFMDMAKSFALPHQPDLAAYPPGLSAQVTDSLSAALDLPQGALSPLQQALELGDVDFTRLPLGEVPAFSLPYAEDDLAMLLFLVSRPYFLAKRDACGLGDRMWEEGKCPVCDARPSISSFSGEGRRQLHCSFCGTVGYFPRVQCPACLNTDPGKLNTYTFAGEEGFSVLACDVCKAYVKTVEPDLLSRVSPDLADLLSLPLDIVIQQKGFTRRSPNPLGMVKMTATG